MLVHYFFPQLIVSKLHHQHYFLVFLEVHETEKSARKHHLGYHDNCLTEGFLDFSLLEKTWLALPEWAQLLHSAVMSPQHPNYWEVPSHFLLHGRLK
jgi:hypothetical protein